MRELDEETLQEITDEKLAENDVQKTIASRCRGIKNGDII